MLVSKSKVLPHLVGLLFVVSMFAMYPQFLSLLHGNYEGLTLGGNYGLRFLRELIVIIIYFLFFKEIVKQIKKLIFLVLPIFLTFCTASCYTIIKYQSLILLIIGFRFLEYILIMPAIYYTLLRKGSRSFFKVFNFYIYFFLAIELVISLFELIFVPPVMGKTLWGTRVFGTFPSPNLFGFTISVCGLFFYIQRKNKPLFLCVLLAILSGSRLASISATILIFAYTFQQTKLKSLKNFLLLLPFLTAIFWKIYSSSEFSGRYIYSEPRIEVWKNIIANGVENITDLVIGWGVGLGSNAITTILGPSKFPGQFISDSTFMFLLGSFGLIGVWLYLIVIFISFYYCKRGYLFWFLLVLYSIPVIWFENFPANVLIVLMWTFYLCKSSKYWRICESSDCD